MIVSGTALYCSVPFFLVRDDDFIALVEVEFGIELRLFEEQCFESLRLFERLFRLFFGDFEVSV